jgi:membrane fusion protein, multidrug efflux system
MKLRSGVLIGITVLLVAVPFAAGAAWRALGGGEVTPAEGDGFDIEGVMSVAVDPAMGSQPVVGVPVRLDTLHLQVVAAGLAEPARERRLASREAGLIQRVHVREGQTVGPGELLVQLDTVQAAMNLVRARAALAQAEARYRERMLGGAGILPPEEEAARERIVRAETGLTTAEIDLVEREMELEFTRIRAPFSGSVADLRAVEGAYLERGGEVLTLMQIDPVSVRVEVLESEIGRMARGRRASVRFNALGGESRSATVESVNPLVDPDSRAGRVTLTLPNPRGGILPGSYAWVTLDAESLPDRIVIPREAVLTRGDRQQDVVFVLPEVDGDGRGVAEMRPVALGHRNDTHVEVVPGENTEMLIPGEIVLVDGHHFLALGTHVHLVEPERGSATGESRDERR